MSQTEMLIYITIIQWTVSIFGGYYTTQVGTVVEGIDRAARVAAPSLWTFLGDTVSFFGNAFIFNVPGALVLSPLFILMGVVELIILANFLRNGIT